MSTSLAIVPAGGKAVRFNGLPKELLPVSQDECALTRCVSAFGTDGVLVFSNHDKYDLHKAALDGMPGVRLVTWPCNGLAEVISLGINAQIADWYYFAMPDTVFPTDAFPEPNHAVMCGTFLTDEPERFGMLRGDTLVDKEPGPPGFAWGAWIWSRVAAEFLADACDKFQDYTPALNALIAKFGMEQFPLRYYYDLASFKDYRKFLKEI